MTIAISSYFPCNIARGSASERSEQAYTPMYIPSLIPLVFFLFGTKKREQITEVSVKEENEVILDRRTEVIGIMEFLQKGKKYVSSKMKHKSTQEQIVKWH